MNAPFALGKTAIRAARLSQPDEFARIERFVAEQRGSVFQRPTWLGAVEAGSGQRARGLLAERDGAIQGWLPLTEVHSPIFGRALTSSGFAVEGGVLSRGDRVAGPLCDAAVELAHRLSCVEVELRGGPVADHWDVTTDSHCGFVRALEPDDEAQLLAIPRKQRAEVRKGLKADLTVSIGKDEAERAAHFAVYAESVRNLGTPVFPRALFDAVLDALDADILSAIRTNRSPASFRYTTMARCCRIGAGARSPRGSCVPTTGCISN